MGGLIEVMINTWFAFTNKGRTAVKLLVYDGQGYWLCIKRFSHGKLAWWPKGSHSAEPNGTKLSIKRLHEAA